MTLGSQILSHNRKPERVETIRPEVFKLKQQTKGTLEEVPAFSLWAELLRRAQLESK